MPGGASVLRGLVLLSCLVTVPSAAVLGTSLPRAVRSVLESDFEIPAVLQAGADDAADASEFEPMPPGEALSPTTGALAPAGWPVAESQSVPRPSTTLAAAITGESESGGGATAPLTSGLGPNDRLPGCMIAGERGTTAASESPARLWEFGDSVDPGGATGELTISGAAAAPSASPDLRPDPNGAAAVVGDGRQPHLPPSSGETFSRVQQRLRNLGAVYYLLETWGDQHQLFRFYCRVAVRGNPAYTRHFEATDADPLRAMGEVVGQVERWRRGASP